MSLFKSSTVNFDKIWDGMQPQLTSLVSGAPQTLSNDKWMGMYSGVYKICTNPGAPQAEMLFFRLRGLLVARVETILEDLDAVDGESEFLQRYCTAFEAFATGTTYISELFRYLNRYWIKYSHCETGQAPVPGVYPITELALHIWHDSAFLKTKKRLLQAIIHIFRSARSDRSEYFSDGDCVAATVQTYFALGMCKPDQMSLYREELEVPFLEDTAQFYSALADELLASIPIAEYLAQAELLCSQEQKRCELRLHHATVAQARQACCRVLVQEHTDRICESVEAFLTNNQTTDLHRVFSLFSELPKEDALVSLKNILKKYIEASGLEIVRRFEHDDSTKNPEGYIEALVQIRNKYFELIKEAFDFHPLMRSALDQACRSFANSHPRLPELLAKYSHCMMKQEMRGSSKHAPTSPAGRYQPVISDDALEKKVDSISVVFCLIDDKDVFKKYYSKYLAKRLIKGSAVANDLEVMLIQKLREICGHDFVSKLQKMLKDKILSKELLAAFTAWLEQHDITLRSELAVNSAAIAFHHSVSYHCDVLTAGAWPISSTSPESKILLPPEIDAHIALFTKFYTERSTGRKLQWIHHLSYGILQTHFLDKRYEFALSFYQMLILLQFNSSDSLTRAAILERTNLSAHGMHHLESLVKTKILLKSGDDANPTLALNLKYSNRKIRVSAMPSAPVETLKVAKATAREVEEDRKMSLQAAIVRVMKTRRDIAQAQLQVEVAEMLHTQFVPTPAMVKQNVEILIQKEYLRRHEDDASRFLYVA